MTFLELVRVADGKTVRVNMDHVSEYFRNHLDKNKATLVYEDGKELDVCQSAEHIDIKIREIEAYRRGRG